MELAAANREDDTLCKKSQKDVTSYKNGYVGLFRWILEDIVDGFEILHQLGICGNYERL